MPRAIINIELNTGEGIVAIEEVDDNLEMYKRAYIPFVGEDEWVLDLIQNCKVFGAFSDWFFKRDDPLTYIVSVQVVPAFDIASDYLKKSLEEAKRLAAWKEEPFRIVMEDGDPGPIGPGQDPTRVNVWVAKGEVYRAEYF